MPGFFRPLVDNPPMTIDTDPGRCTARTNAGHRCKRRDLARDHFPAVVKPTDPDGYLCSVHWQAQRQKAASAKATR